jgi:mono/diheme cytochrome c family protein
LGSVRKEIMMNCSLPRLAVGALALVSASLLLLLDRSVASGPGAAADLEGFRKHVAPFLQQHCVKCHGPEKQKGDLALHALDGNVAGGKDIEKWKAVAERLALNEMPPESEPRPDVKTLASVRTWIKAELAKGGASTADAEAKLLLPGHGNRVDHDALFSGTITGPAASPPRLWRMSPHIYSAFMPRISGLRLENTGRGSAKIAQPLSTSPGTGFKDYADLFTIDEPTIVQLMRNAQQAVEARSVGKGLMDLKTKPTEAEMRAAISRQFQLVLLREPTETELQRFVQLMNKNIAEAGQAVGVRNTLATVLMLPEALYRVELGQDATDQFGRRMLAPRELAYAIAFALTDDGPDPVLLRAAEEGKLKTRDDVRREVERLLNDKAIAKPRIMRFFEEYFEFATVLDVFKDFNPPVLKKGWQPEVLVNDTRHLIQYILDRDRDVLRELLTTNKSFVNYQVGPKGEPMPAWLHPKNKGGKKEENPEIPHWYGLPANWEWTGKQPIELPAEQRAGILTQPSWLAAFATNNENHPIRRGHWVRERLLGGVVPDVPISVDAKLPDAPDQTLRQRLEVTTKEYCWKCHQKMNPLGLTFEKYDYVGRFRTTEPVVDPKAPPVKPPPAKPPAKKPEQKPEPALKQVAVDSTGRIANSGEARLDGDVADAVAMVRKLADSPRVRQVFVRHAFRFWMGRNETLSDSPTLIAADKAYLESGGSMKALIAALLTSDSFLYRFDREPKKK